MFPDGKDRLLAERRIAITNRGSAQNSPESRQNAPFRTHLVAALRRLRRLPIRLPPRLQRGLVVPWASRLAHPTHVVGWLLSTGGDVGLTASRENRERGFGRRRTPWADVRGQCPDRWSGWKSSRV